MRAKASDTELIERFAFSDEPTVRLGVFSASAGERIASSPEIKIRAGNDSGSKRANARMMTSQVELTWDLWLKMLLQVLLLLLLLLLLL
jgi:hypothetical protein